MTNFRTESDSLGEVQVPEQALYGAQTQRAIDNFQLGGGPLPASMLRALISIKRAAARANIAIEQLSCERGDAIIAACDKLLEDNNFSHFPVDIYQTGSGTSSNMNVNEVIAQLARKRCKSSIHPNDHVNASQSSNDTFPSSIRINCALLISHELLPALEHLQKTIIAKGQALAHVVKTGRTHLMDAMPVTFEQSLRAWASQIDANSQRIQQSFTELCTLPQGGTAVGTGINAPAEFAPAFIQKLSEDTGITFTLSENPFAKMGAQDDLVALSGQLKTTAASIIKISNDLRWMNSGPLAGLGEISLPALQPGSSIMPGKVNPVIPEATAMAATQVMGLDTAVAMAGSSGNFELNVMLPLIANNLTQAISLLGKSAMSLADKAIIDFTVNRDNIERPLAKNPILVTALNPVIGYAKAAQIAKQAYSEERDIIDVATENTDLSREQLQALLDPKKLTKPHS